MKILKQVTFAGALMLALAAAVRSGDAHEIRFGDLVIVHPWSRQPPQAADVAAGFLKVENHGTADDRLVKATAEISDTVQIHDMKMEGDVVKMIELPEGILIPAGKTIELKPQSMHIMFMNLRMQPTANTEFRGTLTFERAGTVEVNFTVEEPGGDMEEHH